MSEQFRLSVTLSGGASLGAYQAGAMSALLIGVRNLQERDEERVLVDSVGGASAGALVALFSAYALVEGLDPLELLHEAWVERVSLELLRSRGDRAPLGFEALRDGLAKLLGAGGEEPQLRGSGGRQNHPIAVHIALTGLHGLTYPIGSMRRENEITGVSYADWGRFVLRPGDGPDRLFEPEGASPLDFVLASAANPGGFAPRLLDRSDDRSKFRARGVTNFPDEGCLWYGDGGLVQAEPLGRVLAAARRLEAEAGRDGHRIRRANVMVDPRSEGPSGSDRWVDAARSPSWIEGLSRALAILPAQILYDDLRRVDKDNTRLAWASDLVDTLVDHLDEGGEAAIDDVLERIDEDRVDPREDAPRPEARERGGADVPALRRKLRRAIDEIAGLVGKEIVEVDVISPLLLAEESGRPVPALLAGEFMGDFGGFLRRDLRESDFVLGYESTIVWMRRSLTHAGFDHATMDGVLEEVESRRPGDWREANRGRVQLADLPWGARLQLARFGLHVLRVLAAELLPSTDGARLAARKLRKLIPGR